MGAIALSSTTLTAALGAQTTNTLVSVVSNAGWTVGQYIIANGEAMQIQSKIGTTQGTVQRGMLGTRNRLHNSGEVVYGSTLTLGPTQYEPFSGEQRVTLPDAPPTGLPAYALPLGMHKKDALGNEYVMVDFTTTVYPTQPVIINSDNTATALAVTGRGAMGVVAETGVSTSDTWGWVQVYGRCFVMLGMAGVSPSDAANGPTTLSTSAQTLFVLGTSLSSPNGVGWVSDASAGGGRFVIRGMKVAFDASPADVSAVTSYVGHTGGQIAVFLNFPEITYNL